MGLPGPLGHGFGTPPLDTRLPRRLNRSVRPLVDIQLPAGGLFFFFGTGAHKKGVGIRACGVWGGGQVASVCVCVCVESV